MHSQVTQQAAFELELGSQALALLTGFTVSMSSMLRDTVDIDFDNEAISLATNLTTVELLAGMLAAAVRILHGISVVAPEARPDPVVIPFQRGGHLHLAR